MMLKRIRSDKKFRVMIGLIIISIVMALWASMIIYQSNPREVIVLVITVAIVLVILREIRKSTTKSRRDTTKSRIDTTHRRSRRTSSRIVRDPSLEDRVAAIEDREEYGS